MEIIDFSESGIKQAALELSAELQPVTIIQIVTRIFENAGIDVRNLTASSWLSFLRLVKRILKTWERQLKAVFITPMAVQLIFV